MVGPWPGDLSGKPVAMCINEVINKREDLPATVGQAHGDGAEKQAALGLADDGLTVGTRSDDQKLSKTVPIAV